MNTSNLIIAGDVVPKKINITLFNNGEKEKILGKDLCEIWEKASYKLFNLEAPLTISNTKIKKNGPNLRIDPKAIEGIKCMNPTVVLLANNHIMDYSVKGLNDTINILENNNIDYVGVGKNKQDIKKYYIIKNKNRKIALYNCCETEFSLATNMSSGANGCDLLKVWLDIKKLKEENDFVIILYHGGKEYYRFPSPYLQQLCRNMVDYGADLIVCQHSHCIGCYENYNDKTIVYGQGNFIFDGYDNEYWNSSLLVNVNISDILNVSYIPIKKDKNGTRLANNEEKKEILKSFEERSSQIKESGFIEENYQKFSQKHLNNYLQICHGSNIIYRILNKLCFHKLTSKLYFEKDLLALLNIIECEAHRELLISALKEKLFNKNNKFDI